MTAEAYHPIESKRSVEPTREGIGQKDLSELYDSLKSIPSMSSAGPDVSWLPNADTLLPGGELERQAELASGARTQLPEHLKEKARFPGDDIGNRPNFPDDLIEKADLPNGDFYNKTQVPKKLQEEVKFCFGQSQPLVNPDYLARPVSNGSGQDVTNRGFRAR